MDAPVNEHDIVVDNIIKSNESGFKILSNLVREENYIVQMFPDLILLDKLTNAPVFIIEVKRNGNIAKCIQQWKSVPSIPATLYIIVPESELSNAKAIAQVVGLNTRFGSYIIDNKNNVSVNYE